jgi:hypothetical protein
VNETEKIIQINIQFWSAIAPSQSVLQRQTLGAERSPLILARFNLERQKVALFKEVAYYELVALD